MDVTVTLNVYEIDELISALKYKRWAKQDDLKNVGSPEAQDAPAKIEYINRIETKLERALYD